MQSSPQSFSSGGSPRAYIPTAQPAADQAFQGIVGNLAGQGYGPAGQTYPAAFNLLSEFLTGQIGGQGDDAAFSSGSNRMLGGANSAADYYSNILFPLMSGAPGAMMGNANMLDPYMGRVLEQAFNPAYGGINTGLRDIEAQIRNNPYYSQAQAGAQQGAAYGKEGAAQIMANAKQMLGDAGGMRTAGNQMLGTVPQLLGMGFDPQSQLFNRTQQQLMDQVGAANAMSGVGSSPYGASVMGNALGNFDINWQNNKLNRAALGTQAAGGATNTGVGALSHAAATTAGTLPLYQAAPQLAASSAALPSHALFDQLGAQTTALQNMGKGLNQQNLAGLEGIQGAGGLFGQLNNAYGQAAGLGQGLSQGLYGTGSYPYLGGAQIGQNALSGLTNLTALGNNQYSLPLNVLNELSSYLGLGQAATGLSGNLGQMGFNQAAQGLGGALSGANSLFGQNSLLGGSGGVFGSGGLFGGGAAGGDLASAMGLAETGGLGWGGGGELLSALPFAAS